MKDVHFWGGVGWISALALVALLGDRRGLLRTARDLERLEPSRLNVGQKINALLTAAFAILFLASGLLLFFGERDTRFRWASTVSCTTGFSTRRWRCSPATSISRVIHPATRHSLRGMTTGKVSEEWARRHYPRWFQPSRTRRRQRPAFRGPSPSGRDFETLGGTDPERHLDVLRASRCG